MEEAKQGEKDQHQPLLRQHALRFGENSYLMAAPFATMQEHNNSRSTYVESGHEAVVAFYRKLDRLSFV
uniref:Uncharacterized protein n=2 Tax=Oryza TaxID=4527 RepID=A0A0D3GDW2_9ORYZ